ncbi:hypothetical protein FB451DRAFT_1249271 [Mycena latifolia]|nr:hypothetical protein FB451DRAFT_1249271 [Mycena latifolia]
MMMLSCSASLLGEARSIGWHTPHRICSRSDPLGPCWHIARFLRSRGHLDLALAARTAVCEAGWARAVRAGHAIQVTASEYWVLGVLGHLRAISVYVPSLLPLYKLPLLSSYGFTAMLMRMCELYSAASSSSRVLRPVRFARSLSLLRSRACSIFLLPARAYIPHISFGSFFCA